MTRSFCGAVRRQQPEGQPEGQPARCRRAAGWGTSHVGAGTCRTHLGSTRDHVRHAASLHAQTNAALALQALREGPIVPDSTLVDPVRALRGMLTESATLTGWLRGRVESELGDAWVGDRMAATSRGDLYETSEEVRALVKLYNESIERTAKLAKVCLDAGVDAAMVKLNREQGQQLNDAFREYGRAMGFDPATAARSRREFALALDKLVPSTVGGN